MVLSLYRVLADLTVLQGVTHIRHQLLYLALKQPQLFQAGKGAANAVFFSRTGMYLPARSCSMAAGMSQSGW